MIRTVEAVVSELEDDLRREEGAWLPDELRGMHRGLDEVRQRLGDSTPILETGGRLIVIPIPFEELIDLALEGQHAARIAEAGSAAGCSPHEFIKREDAELIVNTILEHVGIELLGRVDLPALPICPDCRGMMRRLEEEEELGDLGLGSMRPARIVWICGCVPEGEEGAEDERRRSESRETVAPS